MSTPADLHAACLTALEKAKAVLAAATPGPWEVFQDVDSGELMIYGDEHHLADVSEWSRWLGNAAYIVEAVNTRAAGLALTGMMFAEHSSFWTDSHGYTWCEAHSPMKQWPCDLYRDAALTVGVVLP